MWGALQLGPFTQLAPPLRRRIRRIISEGEMQRWKEDSHKFRGGGDLEDTLRIFESQQIPFRYLRLLYCASHPRAP